MYRKIIENLKNRNIAILGFGKEGRSTYNLIRKYLKDKFLYIADNDNNLLGIVTRTDLIDSITNLKQFPIITN